MIKVGRFGTFWTIPTHCNISAKVHILTILAELTLSIHLRETSCTSWESKSYFEESIFLNANWQCWLDNGQGTYLWEQTLKVANIRKLFQISFIKSASKRAKMILFKERLSIESPKCFVKWRNWFWILDCCDDETHKCSWKQAAVLGVYQQRRGIL